MRSRLDAGGSYFTVEWTEAAFGGGWTVPFWRMPLGVLVDEILSVGFLLERIVEPPELRLPPDHRGLVATPRLAGQGD